MTPHDRPATLFTQKSGAGRLFYPMVYYIWRRLKSVATFHVRCQVLNVKCHHMLIHVSDLTQKATTLYKKHFVDFLRVLVWLLVPTLLADLVPFVPTSGFMRKLIVIALGAVTAIIALWLSVVLVDMVRDFSGARVPVKKLADRSWGIGGRAIDLVLVSFLQGLVVALGFILFIIPGLVAWCWFSFARYAVLVDGISPGTQSLKASKVLVTGQFWPIAWRWIGSYLYFGVFMILIISLLLAVGGAVLGNPAIAFRDITAASSLQPTLWWSALVTDVVTVLMTPLFIAVGVLLYEDAKRTR